MFISIVESVPRKAGSSIVEVVLFRSTWLSLQEFLEGSFSAWQNSRCTDLSWHSLRLCQITIENNITKFSRQTQFEITQALIDMWISLT